MRIEGIGGRKTLKQDLILVDMLAGKFKDKSKRKKRSKEITPRNMAEKQLERDIIFALKNRGYEVFKTGETSTYNSQYTMTGISDLIVFIKRYGIVFIEVKQEKYRFSKDGGLREAQVSFKKLCKDCNLAHAVVYTVNEAIDFVYSYYQEKHFGKY